MALRGDAVEDSDSIAVACHLGDDDHADGNARVPVEVFVKGVNRPRHGGRVVNCWPAPLCNRVRFVGAERNAIVEAEVLARRVRRQNRAVAAHVDDLRGVPRSGRVIVGEANITVLQAGCLRAQTVRFISWDQPKGCSGSAVGIKLGVDKSTDGGRAAPEELSQYRCVRPARPVDRRRVVGAVGPRKRLIRLGGAKFKLVLEAIRAAVVGRRSELRLVGAHVHDAWGGRHAGWANCHSDLPNRISLVHIRAAAACCCFS